MSEDVCEECGHPWSEHYDAWACMTCAEGNGPGCALTEHTLAEGDGMSVQVGDEVEVAAWRFEKTGDQEVDVRTVWVKGAVSAVRVPGTFEVTVSDPETGKPFMQRLLLRDEGEAWRRETA